MGAAVCRDREGLVPPTTAVVRPHRAGCALAACAALVIALLALPAHADPASCADPGHLGRGNPGVVGALDVISPCVVDFGDRALVIRGTLRAPSGGVLSLKAGSIDVRHPIVGRYGRRHEAGA